MEKITHNLKQTEQALKDFKNSLYSISLSETNLRTAESSSTSLLFQGKFDPSRPIQPAILNGSNNYSDDQKCHYKSQIENQS